MFMFLIESPTWAVSIPTEASSCLFSINIAFNSQARLGRILVFPCKRSLIVFLIWLQYRQKTLIVFKGALRGFGKEIKTLQGYI